jgi:hypothetical protein
MTNFDLYKLINFIVNKDIYAQAVSPAEFDLELKSKNMRHFRKRLGLPETYIPGSANQGVGVSRVTDADLLPFLVEEAHLPIGGVVTLTVPPYYILDFFTSASITSDLISQEEESSRRENYITKPTNLHITGRLVKGGLSMMPVSPGSVKVIFYRRPVDPVFSTTVNPVTFELTYNALGSVELEWDDGSKLDILNLILQDLGLNIERGDVQQMAVKMVQTGQ